MISSSACCILIEILLTLKQNKGPYTTLTGFCFDDITIDDIVKELEAQDEISLDYQENQS